LEDLVLYLESFLLVLQERQKLLVFTHFAMYFKLRYDTYLVYRNVIGMVCNGILLVHSVVVVDSFEVAVVNICSAFIGAV